MTIDTLEKKLKESHEDFCETFLFLNENGERELKNNDDEFYLKDLLNKGVLFDCRDRGALVCNMSRGECHSNVTEIYYCNNKKDGLQDGDKIYTGYALNHNDEWFTHSWIVDKNSRIVETFDIYFFAYFGFELKGEQLKDFLYLYNKDNPMSPFYSA